MCERVISDIATNEDLNQSAYLYSLMGLHCPHEETLPSRKHTYIILTPLNPTFI